MSLIHFMSDLLRDGGARLESYVALSEQGKLDVLRHYGFVVDATKPDAIVSALLREDEQALGNFIQDALDGVARSRRTGPAGLRYPGDPVVIDAIRPSRIKADTIQVVTVTGWHFGNDPKLVSLKLAGAARFVFASKTCSEGTAGT